MNNQRVVDIVFSINGKASYLCRKKREDEYFVDDYEENDSFDYAKKGYVQERGDEANCAFKGHGIETRELSVK